MYRLIIPSASKNIDIVTRHDDILSTIPGDVSNPNLFFIRFRIRFTMYGLVDENLATEHVDINIVGVWREITSTSPQAVFIYKL